MTGAARFTERLQARVAHAGLTLSPRDAERLERYVGLLAKWNARINLTSLPLQDFPDATLDRLIVEPLIASAFVADAPLVWFDFGSGGGSPAIPLKVVRPALKLTLVESVVKKAAFLREACNTVELEDVQVLATRIENLPAQFLPESAGLVTTRAVRMNESVLHAAAHLLAPSGRLVHFGTDDQVQSGFRMILRRRFSGSANSLFVFERL